MIFGSLLLRSGSIILSALCLSLVAAGCGESGESDSSATVPSPTEIAQSGSGTAPGIPAAVSSPSDIAPSSAQSGNAPNGQGDRSSGSQIYPGMKLIGATEDEGLNIFFGGWTERCADISQSGPDCLKRPVVEYAVGKERITAEVNCGAKTIGNFLFADGALGEGMFSPSGGIQHVVNRACALMYKEGPIGEGVTKDEPTGEPGYVGYDIIGQTESGADVYYIGAQPDCADGSNRSDCDRHKVNLVVGEANSTAVVISMS